MIQTTEQHRTKKIKTNPQMTMWPTHIFLSSFAPVSTLAQSCFPGLLLIFCTVELHNYLKLHDM